jgi:hypothetical protein
MHPTLPLSVAALLAVGIIIIGSLYIASPEKMTGSFGLRLPSPDPDTRGLATPQRNPRHRIRVGCSDPHAYDEPADGGHRVSC